MVHFIRTNRQKKKRIRQTYVVERTGHCKNGSLGTIEITLREYTLFINENFVVHRTRSTTFVQNFIGRRYGIP